MSPPAQPECSAKAAPAPAGAGAISQCRLCSASSAGRCAIDTRPPCCRSMPASSRAYSVRSAASSRRRRGLVGQHPARVLQEHPGEREPLAFAARELLAPGVLVVQARWRVAAAARRRAPCARRRRSSARPAPDTPARRAGGRRGSRVAAGSPSRRPARRAARARTARCRRACANSDDLPLPEGPLQQHMVAGPGREVRRRTAAARPRAARRPAPRWRRLHRVLCSRVGVRCSCARTLSSKLVRRSAVARQAASVL